MDAVNYALIGLGTGAINVLLGLGLVLIYRGSGVINFAHGGLAVVGAYVAMELRLNQEQSFATALSVATLATAGLGLLIHLLVMRPLRHASPLARVIATLGLLTVLTEVVLLQYGSAQFILPLPFESTPVELTSEIVVARQNLILLAIAVGATLVMALLTARTRIGYAISASAENARSAAALGWSPQLLSALTWTVGGALAGAAGAIFPATSTGFISVRQMSVLIIGALATALLAQFRSYLMVLVGGLAIGIAQALATNYINQTGIPDAVPFLVIIAVLIVRGRGLPVRGTTLDRLPRVGTGRLQLAISLPIALVVIVALRLGAPDDWFGALVISLCFALVGLSTVVLTGYAGQLSIAQFGLAGIGAFGAGRLADAQGWPFELALPAGVLAAMVTGLIFGLPALRTRGVNLAVVTFGLGFALHQILFSNSSYTGGEFQTRIQELTIFGIDIEPIDHKANYFVMVAVAFVLTAIVVANVRRGRTGRRLLAVRTNERAAAAVGVSVFQTKLYAFVLASGIAGLGGVLFGFSYSTIQFQELFEADASISLLVVTVIGGVGYVLGPLVGSVLAPAGVGTLFFDTSSAASADADSWVQYLPLITGVLLILTLIISQHGIVDQAVHALSRLTRRLPRRAPAPLEAVPEGERERVAPRTLEVQGLTQRFGGFTALSGVDLRVGPGEVVGLLGPNGAGKTTLIDAVTGYNRVTAGTVRFDGEEITRWSPHKRARAGLTRSFQSLELFDDLTVRENLLAASDRQDLLSGVTDLVWPGTARLSDTVRAAVAELELEDALDLRPDELSYGRRRLVAIARAVASRPSILLLDEPAAGLDENESAELGRLIRRLADTWGIGILLIEHDVPMVLAHADRVLVLDFGVTIADGTPEEIREDGAVRKAYLGESDDAAEVVTAG
ncbi:branched-chain amino acid ABC transporter permease/ATP-binding protein [Nocardioides dubius]|uniref:Branched-chain amino acid ABC transporter permease/ATP-binding protein n=1 Tax=Nocardioides dubius TaxID=317019 RepID=A0ABP4E7X6_9ACTN